MRRRCTTFTCQDCQCPEAGENSLPTCAVLQLSLTVWPVLALNSWCFSMLHACNLSAREEEYIWRIYTRTDIYPVDRTLHITASVWLRCGVNVNKCHRGGPTIWALPWTIKKWGCYICFLNWWTGRDLKEAFSFIFSHMPMNVMIMLNCLCQSHVWHELYYDVLLTPQWWVLHNQGIYPLAILTFGKLFSEFLPWLEAFSLFTVTF